MSNEHNWNSENRLDSVMNVLLIVLALGVLGLGAFDFGSDAVHAATQQTTAA